MSPQSHNFPPQQEAQVECLATCVDSERPRKQLGRLQLMNVSEKFERRATANLVSAR